MDIHRSFTAGAGACGAAGGGGGRATSSTARGRANCGILIILGTALVATHSLCGTKLALRRAAAPTESMFFSGTLWDTAETYDQSGFLGMVKAFLSSSPSPPLKPPPLLCTSISGNGGNWAMSLAVVSESILLYLDEAGDEDALVDLSCVIGASSGSGATMVFMNLLANPNFGIADPGTATHRQARTIARALGFMGMIVDMQQDDMLGEAREVALEKARDWGDGAWEKLVTSTSVAGLFLPFARALVMARRMDTAWLDLPVEELITSQHAAGPSWLDKAEALIKSSYKPDSAWTERIEAFVGSGTLPEEAEQLMKIKPSFSVEEKIQAAQAALFATASDVPTLTASPPAALASSVEDVSRRLKVLCAEFFRDTLNYSVASQALGVHYDDQRPEHHQVATELDLILQEPPIDGLITMVAFEPRSAADKGISGVTYDKHRALAFMSRPTAEAILRSQIYREAVGRCRNGDTTGARDPRHVYLCRYMLAVVDRMRPMQAFGFQEPHQQKPYVARLRDSHVTASFDPLVTASFALRDTTGSDAHNPRIVIMGGYIMRGQLAMLQECYADGLGRPAQFILWSKIGRQLFQQNVLRTLLSATQANYPEHWSDFQAWFDWAPSALFSNVKGAWDCVGTVADIAQTSWKLRLHGAAVARSARGQTGGRRVFDPLPDCEELELAGTAIKIVQGFP